MRHDLTSGYSGLSRKIKALFFSFLLSLFCSLSPLKSYSDVLKHTLKISPTQLKKLDPKKRIILDTRNSWKYILGHVPGAIHFPNWKKFTKTQDNVPGLLIRNPFWIANKLSLLGISKQMTLVVYGSSSDKWRSDGRVFWMLQYYGFDKVTILDGGFENWIKQGENTEKGTGYAYPSSNLSASDINLNSNIMAEQQWIYQNLDSKNITLIDNRTKEEFNGETPYGSIRKGHIPSAIHIDWKDFFTRDGKLKSREALQNLVKKSGIETNKEIVVYCTGGVRSGMAYFALKSLGLQTRNYDGSWWDWSQNFSLPVTTKQN